MRLPSGAVAGDEKPIRLESREAADGDAIREGDCAIGDAHFAIRGGDVCLDVVSHMCRARCVDPAGDAIREAEDSLGAEFEVARCILLGESCRDGELSEVWR